MVAADLGAAATSRDAALSAFVTLQSDAPAGVLEYIGVGPVEYVRVGALLLPVGVVPVGVAAGVAAGVAGAYPLRLASLPESPRLIVHGAGVEAGAATARDGTALAG
jgi:hypothetical protein